MCYVYNSPCNLYTNGYWLHNHHIGNSVILENYHDIFTRYFHTNDLTNEIKTVFLHTLLKR